MLHRSLFVWLLACFLPATVHAEWQVVLSEKHAHLTVQTGGSPVVATDLSFWGPHWKWAGMQAQTLPQGNHTYHTLGQVRDLTGRVADFGQISG